MRKVSIIIAIVMALTVMTASVALADGPRCSGGVAALGTADWANHGQHVIGNYLLGVGIGVDVGWPVEPGSIGEALAGVGPAAPGASGSEDHRSIGPGASFCDPVQP